MIPKCWSFVFFKFTKGLGVAAWPFSAGSCMWLVVCQPRCSDSEYVGVCVSLLTSDMLLLLLLLFCWGIGGTNVASTLFRDLSLSLSTDFWLCNSNLTCKKNEHLHTVQVALCVSEWQPSETDSQDTASPSRLTRDKVTVASTTRHKSCTAFWWGADMTQKCDHNHKLLWLSGYTYTSRDMNFFGMTNWPILVYALHLMVRGRTAGSTLC